MKDSLKILALVSSSVFLAAVFAEIFLRVFLPIEYSMEVEYVADGYLGARLTPNKAYELKSGGTCTVNNLGFRERSDLNQAKPGNTVRIIALGGSSTFSYQTDDEDIWTAVLERKLKNKYGDAIEVINAGVPGYSVFESKINYVYRIRPLDPDIVIVYHTWNDMKLFRAIESGRYPERGVYKRGRFKSFVRHSQIAWRARNFLHGTVYPKRRENTYGKVDDLAVTIEPDGAAHKWERQNYDDLSVLLIKDGVLPVFTSQAGLLSGENIEDATVRSVVYAEYQRLPYDEILAQWRKISDIIEASARANGAVFVDTYNKIPHDLDFFKDHVHLTTRGNEAVAEAIFDGMTSDALVDSLLRTRQLMSSH